MASAAEQLAANLNFGALAKADELKKRIWFTLGALLVYRLGTYIPLPGINPDAVTDLFRQQGQAGVLGLFNMFSGGAVGRLAIFALAIMPYISASIIVQLLSSVIPSFEALKKEGEQGRKILNQYTRYLTLVLAVFQAYAIGVGLQGSGNLVLEPGPFFLLSTTIVESGLDIPTANTLIVHRADMFGLAQLYQLRGRVGRSKTRAYALFTVPANRKLTEQADKRLKVLQSLDTLGAGFQLASHDLDIHGAVNLLGDE